MKVPVNWLNDYIKDLPDLKEVENILTLRGLEVEEIVDGKTGKVIVLELTPNRGDCTSIMGVARELSGALKKDIAVEKDIDINEGEPDIAETFSLEEKSKGKCPVYYLKLIKNLKIARSPDWMRNRLEDCGIRPLNNVIDITNYILMETGQPLHAFDADKINGNKILVREARKGEKIMTLDGIERKLHGGEVVIADNESPVAMAGLMGGEKSSVSESTKNVLLEAAWFSPDSISHSESLHSLKTESSYRFARNVDPGGVYPALIKALNLMEKIAGGKTARGQLKVERKKKKSEKLKLNIDNLNKCLGANISPDEAQSILELIDFKVEKVKNVLKVKVPTFRSDVSREIDLIEEIARCRGYDSFTESLPVSSVEKDLMFREDIFEKTEDILRSEGYWEVVTPSLAEDKEQKKLGFDTAANAVEIANPISENFNILRPNLLSGLLKVALYNLNRNQYPLSFYERGSIFEKGKKAIEKEKLAFVKQSGDFFTAKSAVAAVIDNLNQKYNFNYSIDSQWFKKERSGEILINGKKAGEFGVIKEKVLDVFGLEGQVFSGAHFELDLFDKHAISSVEFTPWSEFPSVLRDISIVADIKLTHSEIYDTIFSRGKNLIKEIKLFDIYTGKGIKKGCKSMSYSIEFNSPEKTLSSEEVNDIMSNIIEGLNHELGVKLRA
ncbi:MAG: phenylalanine--tRNA ligase subunit beta [Elusimicrobiota bacterium]